MIDRNDPDIGRKLSGDTFFGVSQRSVITFASFVVNPYRNPWTPIHDGTVVDKVTFAEWELGIPQYGCQCRRDYAEYKANNPPSFESAESIWLWGVNLHNAVNRKLGKPEITIEEARKIWRRDDANTENSRPDLP